MADMDLTAKLNAFIELMVVRQSALEEHMADLSIII